jgi:hypothetical protein
MEPNRFRPRLDYADTSAFRANSYRGMIFMFGIDFFFILACSLRQMDYLTGFMFQILMELAAVPTPMIIMALM